MTAPVSDPREPAAPPAGRLLDVVDRFFPLAWIGLYLLLPVTGAGADALESNFDQTRDLEALRSVLADGRADAITDNLIGPAYIATAALVHFVTSLTPEDSLIALARTSYMLSVAGCMVLVRVLVRRLAPGPSLVSLAAQFAFVTLVFSAGTWHWSDIPWSHFYAAFLAVMFYVVRFAPVHVTLASSALTGVVLALLALTRSFEFVAVLAAWGLALAILAILRIHRPRRPRAAGVALGACTFVATTAAVYAATGLRGLFLLYRSSRGENYGDLLPEEAATIPTFDFAHVPLKLVQLFTDPCFYSICELIDYASVRSAWRLPLAIQLPALVALPICVIAVAILLGRRARHRELAMLGVRDLRLLVEMTIAASGMTLGYVASTWASSSALGYGFARDFMLPSLLTGVVAVACGFAWLHLALERWGGVRLPVARGRLSPGTASAAFALIGAALLVLGVVGARTYGLPRIESRHLGGIEYTANCRAGICDVEIEAVTVSGKPISIPQSSLLTFGCGGDKPRFTLHVTDPSEGFPITQTCRDPRLVAAWPTVMGVPPNSSVLRVVTVVNATTA